MLPDFWHVPKKDEIALDPAVFWSLDQKTPTQNPKLNQASKPGAGSGGFSGEARKDFSEAKSFPECLLSLAELLEEVGVLLFCVKVHH
jgi:hypothetical protein